MNPIDSYRDPGLDGLIGYRPGPPPTTATKPSRHSRQSSMATREMFPPPHLPPAPEVPAGPAIAYPGAEVNGRSGTIQRSFSQRAKSRPYADEAFADEYLGDLANHEPVQGAYTAPKPQPTVQRSSQGRSALADNTKRQQLIQDNIRSAANAARSPRDQYEPRAQHRSAYEDVENTLPGLAPAATLRDTTTSSDQRDWAPDKSPLQKLKVTLDNISKEEKRARVQEAEMLHREKTRSQRPPSGRTDMPVTRPQPATIEDVGMVRSLTNTHKDRLQHSTVIESRRPDARRLSHDKPGFEYQSAALPVRSVTITRRSNRTSSQPTVSSHPPVDQPQFVTNPVLEKSSAQPRSVSAAQPISRNITTEPAVTGAAAKRSSERRAWDVDRIPTSQERNASHRAALQQLEGPVQSSKTRSERRDLRDGYDSPQTISRETSTLDSHDPPRSRGSNNLRTVTPTNQPPIATFGSHGSPGLRSVDSPVPADKPNPVQRQKRQSSVSFKDPYERRRPLDEWRSAETARLDADDLSLEPRQDVGQNKAWWEQDSKSKRRSSRAQAVAAADSLTVDDRVAEFKPRLLVKCGPLLRYTGMKRTIGEGAKEYWRGTIMMVTQDSQSSYEKPPTLRLFPQPKSLYTHPPAHEQDNHENEPEHFDPLAGCTKMSRVGRVLYVRPAQNVEPNKDLSKVETDDGLFASSPPITSASDHSVSVAPVAPRLSVKNGESYGRYKEVGGVRLYADPDRDVTFWLFKVEIQLGPEQQHIGYRINGGAASGFWVPAQGQTMQMMFHSCNGFSMSVKPDDFSGPDPLWRDVLNAHQSRPFHVMIGGGDQIYNDKVMNQTRLFGEWTLNKNPHYKHHAPFTNEMKEELETFYLENYSSWFSQGLFAMAASQIPMVNMWDDHDIIDGFGSYPDAFQLSPVFSGVGNVAYKYYMLFQQHSVEAMMTADEPSWVLGYKPGRYIKQLSRSILLDFGRAVAFLALDCRTERTKNQVLSVDSCDVALERCRKEIVEGQTKHLIVLLGVPIAYPRMNWLENVLTSRAMEPVKALGRYGVLKGGFLNRFDGGVEVLDDLDDHWTAQHHKEERNEFIKELQDLAAERSVRITILGGDVHLGAIGQFYSNPKLKIPKDRDHRYMPNVISSAIVNTPPPEMLADVLNKRNKVHHLDAYTDESMIPMFTHDVTGKKRNNKHLLPRRNWCSIAQYTPGRTPPTSRSASPTPSQSSFEGQGDAEPMQRRSSLTRADMNPRTLIRRLSKRNAPPNAYDNPYKASRPLDPRVDGSDGLVSGGRAASFDDMRPDRSTSRSWNERLGLTRRTASETRQPISNSAEVSNDNLGGRQVPPLRPGFHRRPTNLSEKAAKKGNVPAVDAEGNEFDVNDHVNLDGGLDIVLNFEVDRSDPRGATEPYRLLVPGLWYDGSSDREKLDVAHGVQRKPTLMNKLGLGGTKGHGAAKQGAGNWGQDMSDTESYSGSDTEREDQPRKKFGLFGSLRRKRPDQESGEKSLQDEYDAATGIAGNDLENSRTSGPPEDMFHNRVTSYTSTTPKNTPPKMSHQVASVGYDPNVDRYEPVQSSRTTFNKPTARSNDIQTTNPSQTSAKGNVLRKNSIKRSSVEPTDSQLTGVVPVARSQQPYSEARPSATTEYQDAGPPRRNSYTIGVARGSGSGQNFGRNPYDEDSAYMSTNASSASRAASNPVGSHPIGVPPSSFPTGNNDSAGVSRGSSLRSGNGPDLRHLSSGKEDQILGIGTDNDTFAGNPQQRSLRGNGILGRLTGSYKRNTSSDYTDGFPKQAQTSPKQQQQPLHGQDEFGAPQRTLSQGYSGIEAYREKPKRGLSLRDRARNLLDRVEGRRYDDDNYSFSSEVSYSDDLGEVSGQQQHHPQSRQQQHLHEQQGRSHSREPHEGEYYSDGEGSFVDEAPKRGFSQRLRAGMARMGSRRGQETGAGGDGVEGQGEGKYY